VRVQFSGGRVEHADILIGGDGIRSSVRAQMAPEVQPVYAGYYIWRGRSERGRSRPGDAEQHLPLFTFYLPKQQQVITYPIAGFNDDLTPGKRPFQFHLVSRGGCRKAARDVRGRKRACSTNTRCRRRWCARI
jgi:2-polyprenyl-6-methoxyphenol hydroxylase-like FAD-dependent oxidoreductase